MARPTIYSIPEFIEAIEEDSEDWNSFPWFRGETNYPKDKAGNPTQLLPKLYRKTDDGRDHNENRLLQNFRLKAPTLGLKEVPDRNHTDQWLFLAQHSWLPTRLLDWTESALVALYFALSKREPVVWMLNPIALNNLSLGKDNQLDDYIFPLTWFGKETLPLKRSDLVAIRVMTTRGENEISESAILVPPEFVVPTNIGNRNVRAAWEPGNTKVGTLLPVAILPTNIHPRMSVQKSCFTIHGRVPKPLPELVRRKGVLFKYRISKRQRGEIIEELRLLGVSYSTIFPDLDGLARELELLF